jgi:hypothetical protein
VRKKGKERKGKGKEKEKEKERIDVFADRLLIIELLSD